MGTSGYSATNSFVAVVAMQPHSNDIWQANYAMRFQLCLRGKLPLFLLIPPPPTGKACGDWRLVKLIW